MINRKNEWTFLPILIFDFCLLLAQFYCVYAVPVVRIGCFLQFTMSLLVCLYYVLQHRYGSYKVANKQAESLDLDKERSKLATQQSNLKLGPDAYCQLFKAYHISSANDMSLLDEDRANAMQGAMFCFVAQLSFLVIIYNIVFDWDNTNWKMTIPSSFEVLLARCLSVMSMHLQLEHMLTTGLEIMKFTINHPDQFIVFFPPFMAGFCIFSVTLATEILLVFFTATFDTVINAVQKQVSLAFIARTAAFYGMSLASSNKLKQRIKPIQVQSYRLIRHQITVPKDQFQALYKISKGLYSFSRLLHCTFIYYMLPLTALILPYLVLADHYGID